MKFLISQNTEYTYGSKVKKIKKRLPEILENPVIKEFLEDKSNSEAFYRYNRIIRYLTGLIKRYPIDYDKRIKMRNSRYPLIMDSPINKREHSNTSMVDLLPDNRQSEIDSLILKETGFFYIENDTLYKAIKKLNSKQWVILFLYYEKGFNNKEISQIFGQTEQNISYWHKKTLDQLRKSLEA